MHAHPPMTDTVSARQRRRQPGLPLLVAATAGLAGLAIGAASLHAGVSPSILGLMQPDALRSMAMGLGWGGLLAASLGGGAALVLGLAALARRRVEIPAAEPLAERGTLALDEDAAFRAALEWINRNPHYLSLRAQAERRQAAAKDMPGSGCASPG